MDFHVLLLFLFSWIDSNKAPKVKEEYFYRLLNRYSRAELELLVMYLKEASINHIYQ